MAEYGGWTVGLPLWPFDWTSRPREPSCGWSSSSGKRDRSGNVRQPISRLVRTVKFGDVNRDDSTYGGHDGNHFAEVDRLAERAPVKRELGAQLLFDICDHFLRQEGWIDKHGGGQTEQSRLKGFDL